MSGADNSQQLPLAGIRVVDFTQVMMGPVCTQMLADHGADVIKIERKGAGDLSRSTFAPIAGEDNPIFCSLNRNKRSCEIDLRDAAQLDLVKALIADADVVTNNFRAGVMERLGLGYEDCRRLNPRIIYAVGTGFGESGPYAHKGGQDVLAQALTGVMARRADASIPVSIYPTALADYTAGMHMVQGILFALLQRERTGEGQKVAVSLYNSMLAMQMQEAAMVMMDDSEVNWAAMPLSGVFDTQTGPLVLVGAFKANPLRDICTALGIADLSADARFATLEAQFRHKPELHRIFRERFASDTREHWLARLAEQDLLSAA
ncbi:MAG TPA: CoA transferase, partial [Pseudorhodoferax sp.]|nr:CoA transferase [Pseudorhodoferax sp.]